MSWKTAFVLLVVGAALCGGELIARSTRQADVMLRLNVPAFRLDLLEAGVVTATYPVAVGEPRYRTPGGEFRLTHITWNPWWYPPASEWAREETIHPPGSTNPMGGVKLQFGGLYFLHGTPFETSIGKAASHGCVRMYNVDARALARAVNRLAGGGVPDDTLDAIELDSSRTVTVELREPLPIAVVYVTVEVYGGRLYVHRDVYGRDRPSEAAALEILARAGYDTSRVDRLFLARVVRRARSRSTSVPVDSLLFPLASAIRPPPRELADDRR
jgi:murein L,D-transpeptidase YcbB/YkuD